MIVVFDKGGLEGQLAEDNDLDDRADALALLSDGRQVRIPPGMLRQRSATAYDLPVHFAELEQAPSPHIPSPDGDVVVPVYEETLDIGSWTSEEQVEIRKTVTEREQAIELPLRREDVEIERVRIDRPVAEPVPVRQEGETLIIPLLEEEIVTRKQLVLREELRITRRQTREDRTETVTLRSEDAVVTRSGTRTSTKETKE